MSHLRIYKNAYTSVVYIHVYVRQKALIFQPFSVISGQLSRPDVYAHPICNKGSLLGCIYHWDGANIWGGAAFEAQ